MIPEVRYHDGNELHDLHFQHIWLNTALCSDCRNAVDLGDPQIHGSRLAQAHRNRYCPVTGV